MIPLFFLLLIYIYVWWYFCMELPRSRCLKYFKFIFFVVVRRKYGTGSINWMWIEKTYKQPLLNTMRIPMASSQLVDTYNLITKYETSKYLIYSTTMVAEGLVECCISFHIMMTPWNGNIFCVTGLYAGNLPVTGEFPSLKPLMRSFDVFFDLHLNKRLSKQSIRW